jgi:hypothetical protein
VRTEHRVLLSDLPAKFHSSWMSLKEFLTEIVEPVYCDVMRNGEGIAEFNTAAEADLLVSRLPDVPAPDGTILTAKRDPNATRLDDRNDRRGAERGNNGNGANSESKRAASRSRSRDRNDDRGRGRGRERDRSRSREGDAREEIAGAAMDEAPAAETAAEEQVDYSPEVEAEGAAEEVQEEDEEEPARGRGRAAAKKAPAGRKKKA